MEGCSPTSGWLKKTFPLMIPYGEAIVGCFPVQMFEIFEGQVMEHQVTSFLPPPLFGNSPHTIARRKHELGRSSVRKASQPILGHQTSQAKVVRKRFDRPVWGKGHRWGKTKSK